MIIFLIGIVILLIGIIAAIIESNTNSFNFSLEEALLWTAFIGITIGSIMVFVMTGIFITNHAGIDAGIHKYEIEHDGLVKRLEIINSDYEDVSKSDVIKDITEWNKDVYSEKYWSSNPWTNWFYSQRFVDSLEYIELEE